MVRHHLLTASLAITIFLSSCAQIPRYTEDPTICNPDMWGDQYNHNVVEWVKASGRVFKKAMPYICVDVPEIVNMPSYFQLLDLPPAETKPVVAVYKFQDLTGQRKALDGIASFSTAVTQGADAMLIDALKSAGGGTWFRVVERQGLDNLVRERQIIRSARQDVAKANGKEEAQGIQPLLFAGMIIEGGIIGYDTNILSGGRGARTLGIGASRQYRKDVVTISIRAVSVLTGEVLLNVQSKKTILSYGSGGDVFRFIEQGTQLIEYEDGVGKNESVTYAVRSAIEAGVFELINQGHDRGFWVIKGKEK